MYQVQLKNYKENIDQVLNYLIKDILKLFFYSFLSCEIYNLSCNLHLVHLNLQANNLVISLSKKRHLVHVQQIVHQIVQFNQ
jgi:hypothetical protein